MAQKDERAIHEYIVFRGSDVKDLRVEEPPAPTPEPPKVPNDPAILGVSNLFLSLSNAQHQLYVMKDSGC
jgi:hypothetical protein